MRKDAASGLSLLAVLLLAMQVTGCNSTASGDEGNGVAVQGSWSGNYVRGSRTDAPIFAIIQKDGPGFFFDETGVMYVLPRLDGSDALAGNVRAYPAIGYRFADGSTEQDMGMTGTAQDSEISGDLAGDSDSAHFDLLPLETFHGKPAIVPGQWQGYYVTPTPSFLSLDMHDDGSFTGTDIYGCDLSGRLSSIEPGSTVFAASITSHGPSPACGGTLTGLVHESSVDSLGYYKHAPGTYYYIGVFDRQRAFVAELKAQ